ncbi:glycoside hydrolase family 13 protein [Jonesia quinghaiensis]|uniref:glycoside hydrolase family 13 protein n=1 Tax=Jonesia quinghaiensis TaxID=262806 RepID=UPI000402986E|nr:glycoside hydrolase family 13 protein [Jonesia quinghaiensis]
MPADTPRAPHVNLPPHHDGSSLYVSTMTPQLGETVTVRLRVPAGINEQAVHVRMVRDGEPRLATALLTHETADERWYEADVLVHNPRTNYRFLIVLDNGYGWLNQRGWFLHDVPDANDYQLTTHAPAPAWVHEGIIYQIFPDRFARSSTAPALSDTDLPPWAIPATDWNTEPIASGAGVSEHFYGGDLDGIVEHLDHIHNLGVKTVYLTPIFPGRSNHRYDASTFDEVDPLLGGNSAYERLATEIHHRGLRIMGDITTNHTGAGHEWFQRANSDPTAPEHSYYYWTPGEPGYVCWLEHDSLPKLNYTSHELRNAMINGPQSVIGRWMQAPFNLDGWRVDVANMTGRYRDQDTTHDIAATIRTTMTGLNNEALLIAEHFHDASADLGLGGWHGNMNYSAFTRPIWGWLAADDATIPAFGLPATMPRIDGHTMVDTMRTFDSVYPFTTLQAQWNMLGSHDTPRLRTLVGTPERVELAAALLFTYLGCPVVFAGDEVGLTGTNGEHARQTMPWNDPTRWDATTHDLYRTLITLRAAHPALATGSLRWIHTDTDAVVYLRENNDEAILISIARAPWSGATIPTSIATTSASHHETQPQQPTTLYGNQPLPTTGNAYTLPGIGPAVHMWRIR